MFIEASTISAESIPILFRLRDQNASDAWNMSCAFTYVPTLPEVLCIQLLFQWSLLALVYTRHRLANHSMTSNRGTSLLACFPLLTNLLGIKERRVGH